MWKWHPSLSLCWINTFLFMWAKPVSPPLFSPQVSYITSTQLIFTKIINELHCLCVCARGENRVEWLWGLQPASVKYLLQRINVCVGLCVVTGALSSLSSSQALYSWQTVTVKGCVDDLHLLNLFSSVVRRLLELMEFSLRQQWDVCSISVCASGMFNVITEKGGCISGCELVCAFIWRKN